MQQNDFREAISRFQDDIVLIEAQGSLNRMQIVFKYKNEKIATVQSAGSFDISLSTDGHLYEKVEKMNGDEGSHFLELLSSAAYLEVCDEVMPEISDMDDFMSIEMDINFNTLT
tara:strand:- start:1661 stop:2002 length:342 start_codon:yes stop_codon:yes gene_type:complete